MSYFICAASGGELNAPQPPVEYNPTLPATWELVIADMRERDRIGRRKYGTPLQPCNGRDSLVDAYQEALDLCVYLRNEIETRKLSGPQAAQGVSEMEPCAASGGEIWRVGSKVPLNVYEGDRPVCQCHNRRDAHRIASAMNFAIRELAAAGIPVAASVEDRYPEPDESPGPQAAKGVSDV
jgi:hypothetical protein